MRLEENRLHYSDRGFVGAIVRDGEDLIVVLRGSDMGTAGVSEIL
jgi:hypothetical protein